MSMPLPYIAHTAQPLQIVSKCFFAMPLRCIAERRVSAQRLCFSFRHHAQPCLRFSTRGPAFPLLCLSMQVCSKRGHAFAPRCTAVTTCAPAEQTCQHNAVAELCAHIRAFANHIIAVADQILSMQCRCSVDDVKGEAALAAVSPLADAAQNAVVQPLQNRILERFVHE